MVVRNSSLPQPHSLTRRTLLAGATAFATAAWADATQQVAAEPILDPGLPIVDPHHHFWDGKHPASPPRYLASDLVHDMGSGHRIVGTVFIECTSRYWPSGPEIMRQLGETAFVIEQARTDPRIARAIFGHVDLMAGDAASAALNAQVAAGQGRFRGIRQSSAWDSAPVFHIDDRLNPLRLDDSGFRRGFALLAPMGLSFDAWGFHTNLAQIAALAAAFPDTTIVLNHAGSPLGTGPYAKDSAAMFSAWRRAITLVAERPNVILKFGGLGMAFGGPPLAPAFTPRGSVELAAIWKPWFDVCVDLFGPTRMMFESNFPVDRPNASYATLWNAFKRLAATASPDERAALFSRTAIKTYRLSLPTLAEPV